MATATTTAGSPLPQPKWYRQPALLRRVLTDLHPTLDELAGQLGAVYGLGAGPMRLAVIGDPAVLRELFALPEACFRWGHKFNVLGFVVGEGSMIVSDGADHKRRRSSVQAGFSRRRLNGWIPMIVERTDDAVDALAPRLSGGRVSLDLYPVGRSLVLDIVVRALFGARMGDRVAEIGELFQRPQDYIESSALHQLPHPLPFTDRARVRADRRALDAIIDAEIDERRRHPAGDPLDVLEVLVNDGTLADSEIRDQVITLIGAGYDTTAASLAWMLWCSVLAPGLWDRLRAEADEVFGPLAAPAQADEHALARLDLARRVMHETLRLHPAGPVSPREAAQDLTVGGRRIRKGTLILWSAHLAGRDPTAWPDPLRFDPERFTAPTAEQKALSDAAWVPFGRGSRNCIGFALAQMELTLILARLAQRLDLAAVITDMPAPKGTVVSRPAGGATFEVSQRQ